MIIFPAIAGNDFPSKGLVEAFVPTARTTSRTTNSVLLFAKAKSEDGGKKKKNESSPDNDAESKDSFLGSFFKGKDPDASSVSTGKASGSSGDDGDESSKGVPIIGRFFKSDEEKADKEERKRLKKLEKERIKLEKRKQKLQPPSESDDGTNNKKRSKIIPAVKNYLEDRQIRKDAEQRELEAQMQMEKDAEELRLEVQRREQERRKQQKELRKAVKAEAKATSSLEDSLQRQLAAQKELDQKRKESKKKRDKDGSSSSKSQRFGSVVSAAQKFVSGVFENDQKKNEEWIVVIPKTRISPGEIVPVTAGGIDLLLVASKDGSAVHCVANSCPHLGTPLEVGTLERLPVETSSSSSTDATDVKPAQSGPSFFQENDISRMLKEDGCEDCIVCPLHKTAFALNSGEVRGEWCPYPPVIGKLTGAVKQKSNLPVFDVRTKGKNIEIRLNTPVEIGDETDKKTR